MNTVVLDASFALALVLPDESSSTAERLLRDAAAGKVTLMTALLWPLEVGNGLLEASRRRRISAGDRLIAFDFLLGLPVTIGGDSAPAPELFAISDEDRLSLYDACYLAVALQQGARLATADGPLRRAARRRGVLWPAAA